jgi:hypothetical protein
VALMGVIGDYVSSLLGLSTYSRPANGNGPYRDATSSLESAAVERMREVMGGQLSPLPTTRTRWYMADLESAQTQADNGDLSLAAQLYRSMRRDGVYSGILSTLTGGLVRLPKRFYGNAEIIESLKHRNGTRSVFDEMHPPSELKLLADDGKNLGVGVAELLPVIGRDYPVLVRLDPEWLRYRWNENRWYYNSIAGPLPITPGDGRWVLHTPGGRIAPWQQGVWHACGRAWISKEHALLHEANWEAKLANPARVAVAPMGASESQKQSWFKQVMAWGVNTVFGMTPGYDVKLLESNGRGYESFAATITRSEREYMIALAGQVVTTDGGIGFANADIHKSIRADLIQETGDGLAHTLNTQTLPIFVALRYGVEAIQDGALVEWDVRPPADLKDEAESYQATAKAIVDLGRALKPYSRRVDVDEIMSRGGVPSIAPDPNEAQVATTAAVNLAPSDLAKVVRVDEARAGQGLEAIGDARGALTLAELDSAPPAGAPGTGAPPPQASAELAAPDALAATDAPPTDASAHELASKMTEHRVERCEHGSVNRCRLCGIERVRDFEPGDDGTPQWRVAWRSIVQTPMKEAA